MAGIYGPVTEHPEYPVTDERRFTVTLNPHPFDGGQLASRDCIFDAQGKRADIHAPIVDRLNFRIVRQWYRDGWHSGALRMCRFTGSCVVCGRRTYSFDDGGDDPRGPLGDHSDTGLRPEDYDDIRTGERFPASAGMVPLCAIDDNDYDGYKRAVAIAMRRWRKAVPAT